MSVRAERAVEKFSAGYNCAQSVAHAFSDDVGLEPDLALKLACGFGAGMGRKEEVCGAVSGGILVLGSRFGRGEREDSRATETTYAKTRRLVDEFTARHGTVLCRRLLGGIELTTDDGQRRYREQNLADQVCKPCVRSAVEILEGIFE